MRSRLDNMSAEELLNGIKLCLENANSMFSAGIYLKEQKFYGLANSILILCCEEGIKAFTIYNYFLDDDHEIDNIFKRHTEKFEILKEGYQIISNEALTAMMSFEVAKKQLPNEEPETIVKRANTLVDLFSPLIHELKLPSTEMNKQWWSQANLMKQNGFYVDIKNSNWITPQQVTFEQVEETHRKASLIMMHLTAYHDIDISKYNSGKSEKINAPNNSEN